MPGEIQNLSTMKCNRCGCTQDDCTQCVLRTGEPCFWIRLSPPLCSACTTPAEVAIIKAKGELLG